MDSNHHIPEDLPTRFPGALSLKDLITLVSVAVSLTIAWGVFGTRLTLIEKDVENQKIVAAKLETTVEKHNQEVARLDLRVQDDAILIDNLYDATKIKQPRRRLSE